MHGFRFCARSALTPKNPLKIKQLDLVIYLFMDVLILPPPKKEFSPIERYRLLGHF